MVESLIKYLNDSSRLILYDIRLYEAKVKLS